MCFVRNDISEKSSLIFFAIVFHRELIVCQYTCSSSKFGIYAYNIFQYLLTVIIYEYFCIYCSKWFIYRRAYVK